MAHALSRVRSLAIEPLEYARAVMVCACALALIAAG